MSLDSLKQINKYYVPIILLLSVTISLFVSALFTSDEQYRYSFAGISLLFFIILWIIIWYKYQMLKHLWISKDLYKYYTLMFIVFLTLSQLIINFIIDDDDINRILISISFVLVFLIYYFYSRSNIFLLISAIMLLFSLYISVIIRSQKEPIQFLNLSLICAFIIFVVYARVKIYRDKQRKKSQTQKEQSQKTLRESLYDFLIEEDLQSLVPESPSSK